MGPPSGRLRGSLALLTDLYQFTMAYGYWRAGRHREPAEFELFFRRCPFQGGFALAAGLSECLAFLRTFRFSEAAMPAFSRQWIACLEETGSFCRLLRGALCSTGGFMLATFHADVGLCNRSLVAGLTGGFQYISTTAWRGIVKSLVFDMERSAKSRRGEKKR